LQVEINISAADLLADVSNIKLETTTAERSLNMPQQGYNKSK
jgi:hypothetical protein